MEQETRLTLQEHDDDELMKNFNSISGGRTEISLGQYFSTSDLLCR
jgi:hypothetical protein